VGMALVSALSSAVGYVSHWVGKNWSIHSRPCRNWCN
jgi:hypothetical protein